MHARQELYQLNYVCSFLNVFLSLVNTLLLCNQY